MMSIEVVGAGEAATAGGGDGVCPGAMAHHRDPYVLP